MKTSLLLPEPHDGRQGTHPPRLIRDQSLPPVSTSDYHESALETIPPRSSLSCPDCICVYAARLSSGLG